MSILESPRPTPAIHWVLAISVLLHLVVLLVPLVSPPSPLKLSSRMEATLTPRPGPEKPVVTPLPQEARPPSAAPPPPRKKILTRGANTAAGVGQPKWSVAQKNEMNRFLDDLAGQQRAQSAPSLAEQSRGQAREIARNAARQQNAMPAELREGVERIPNSPDPHPLSLEMYFEGMIKRLNRSATFVKQEGQNGNQGAAVLIRVNPDGSLNRFAILNAGDQQGQIAYVEAVVRQSIPFLPFPKDIRQSAQTLSLIICIRPNQREDSRATFSRLSSARSC